MDQISLIIYPGFFWGQVYTLTILAGYRKTTVFMHKIIEKSYLKLFGQFEPKFAGIFLECTKLYPIASHILLKLRL